MSNKYRSYEQDDFECLKSFMFNFSKTDAHICFTEYVLLIYRVKCILYDVT